jgi:hypothetical protein
VFTNRSSSASRALMRSSCCLLSPAARKDLEEALERVESARRIVLGWELDGGCCCSGDPSTMLLARVRQRSQAGRREGASMKQDGGNCLSSSVHCPLSTVHCPLSTVHYWIWLHSVAKKLIEKMEEGLESRPRGAWVCIYILQKPMLHNFKSITMH